MATRAIRYRPEAAIEIEEAAEWYRSRDERAAARWCASARASIESILKNPKLRAADDSGIREALISHYPYKIVYRVLADSVEIVAVVHTSREPDFWRRRLESGH